MKRLFLFAIPFVTFILAIGCSSGMKHHDTDMPDPKSYNAHFGDMDTNGDGLVNWEEFNAHFQDAQQNVFNAIDLDQNGTIDHDEWHEFKAAHGLTHQ